MKKLKFLIPMILVVFIGLIALVFWLVKDPLDKVYETKEDKYIAKFIEENIKNLQKLKVENENQFLLLDSINIELKNVDKICYISPYGDLKWINKAIGFEWKYGEEWKKVLYDDRKCSFLLLKGNQIIPFEIPRYVEINNEYTKPKCSNLESDNKLKISIGIDKKNNTFLKFKSEK